jgi:mercuric ion binding protein
MKRMTSLALILVVFTLVAASANADGVQEQEATFTVDKMTCAVCPITVRKSMQRVDGVKDVSIDFDAKTATVIYDPTRTDAKQIGKASSDVGFPATVIEYNTQ